MRSRTRHLDRRCPRCGYVQSAAQERCSRCGAEPADARVGLLGALSRRAGTGEDLGSTGTIATVLLVALMVWVGLPTALRSPVTASQEASSWAQGLIQMADLVFHEAGHWIFAPFGRFMTVLGGSLLEVLVPTICAAAFVIQGDRRGASFGVWWTGQALAGVAVYVADARAGRLMLLGGRTGGDSPGFHDWHNLLSWTGLLPWDHALGWAAHLVGIALMVAGTVWCAAPVITARGTAEDTQTTFGV